MSDKFELELRHKRKRDKRQYNWQYNNKANQAMAKMRQARRKHQSDVEQDFLDRIVEEPREITYTMNGGTEVTQLVFVKMIPPCNAEGALPRTQTAFVGCKTGKVLGGPKGL